MCAFHLTALRYFYKIWLCLSAKKKACIMLLVSNTKAVLFLKVKEHFESYKVVKLDKQTFDFSI